MVGLVYHRYGKFVLFRCVAGKYISSMYWSPQPIYHHDIISRTKPMKISMLRVEDMFLNHIHLNCYRVDTEKQISGGGYDAMRYIGHAIFTHGDSRCDR